MKVDNTQILAWCNKHNQDPMQVTALIKDVVLWASLQERHACVAYLIERNLRSFSTELNLHRASATTSTKDSAIFALNEVSTIKEIGPSRLARIRQALEALPND